MKPAGKTPYEIRLELLQLSQIILHQQHCARAAGEGNLKPMTAPTTEDIVAEADKMNTFISKAT